MKDKLAIVEEGAVIGKNVTIEPFAVIKKNVVIKDNAVIKSHAYVDGYTTIGKNCTIWPFAVIGTKTQDLKYKGEKTFVDVGENCEIREFVTINSSCKEGSTVKIGKDCLIMAYCHVAHNCRLGDRVIMSNGAMLAGHVEIGDFAIIGGMTPVHQFVRIGKYSMVGGLSRVSYDIPPYSIGGGDPFKFGGINIVGLQRNNFSLETRRILSQIFKITFRNGFSLKESIKEIEKKVKQTEEVKHWIDFLLSSKRGIMGMHGVSKK